MKTKTQNIKWLHTHSRHVHNFKGDSQKQPERKEIKTLSFVLGTLHQIRLINILICLKFELIYLITMHLLYVCVCLCAANYNKNSYKLC